jgi:hypothetical protein
MELLLSAFLILVFAAVNVWATLRVVRDQLLSTSQRSAQLALIWLLPVLGVLFVLMFRPSDAVYVPRPHVGLDPIENRADPSFYQHRSAAWDGSHEPPSGNAGDSSPQ